MKLWIVVPFRDGPDLLDDCLASIAEQDDPDFGVVVADDASTDPAVAEVVARWCARPGWFSVVQRENLGALGNIRAAVRFLQVTQDFPVDDVCLLVDGDDRLAHPGVVSRLRKAYDGPVDFAFGSYVATPADDGCPPARALPADVLRYGLVRAFTRDVGAWVNHPLSFRRRLFDVLRDDDFTLGDGTPIRHCYDTALAMPMIEAAGERVAYVDEVLYLYSAGLDDAVHVVHKESADAENEWLLSRPKKYAPMEEPCV